MSLTLVSAFVGFIVRIVEKIRTHILYSITFCQHWITTAIDTHLEYVILIAFP